MRILKIGTLATFTLLLSHTANAQFYVNVGVGYGAPALRELVAVEYKSTQTTDTYTGVYSSLGQGFQPQIAFGYKLNPNIGVELGYGYLMGSKITADINDASNPNFTETGTQELKAQMQRIIIGTRVAYTEGDIHPYMRMGIVVGIGTKVTGETNTTTTGPLVNSTYHRVEEYTGGVSVGFTGGLGITYHLTERFGIFAEAGVTMQNYSPDHSEITTYDVDGQNQLGNMNIRQKQTDYVKEYTNSGNQNDGAPDQNLRFHFPMSSFGIGVGVHFWFPEK